MGLGPQPLALPASSTSRVPPPCARFVTTPLGLRVLQPTFHTTHYIYDIYTRATTIKVSLFVAELNGVLAGLRLFWDD
eukprot:scaffold9096_cov145-Isochrysis_galbana.AAC.1